MIGVLGAALNSIPQLGALPRRRSPKNVIRPENGFLPPDRSVTYQLDPSLNTNTQSRHR